MKIISMAWTAPAVLAGQKTVTRRDWDPKYAAQFHKADVVLAYDRSPRIGGKAIARLRLTHGPRYEPDAWAPDSDYEAEGFAFMHQHGVSAPHIQEWQRAGRHHPRGILPLA